MSKNLLETSIDYLKNKIINMQKQTVIFLCASFGLLFSALVIFIIVKGTVPDDLERAIRERPQGYEESSLERVGIKSGIKAFFGIKELPLDTIAIVDDKIITLKDVEDLADLNYITRSDESVLTIDYILNEYAFYLFELIEQVLISKELEISNIPIDYENVKQIEAIIRRGYSGAFDRQLELEGIDVEYWRTQLRRRLEKETLQSTIISQLRITSQEIANYYNNNTDLFTVPDRYNVIMFSSSILDELQKAHKKPVLSLENAKDYNISGQEGFFATENVPEQWQEELKNLERRGYTNITHLGTNYSYLALVEKIPSYTQSQTESFLVIERHLREEKADKAYTIWLTKALENAKIQIVPEFAEILMSNPKTYPPFEGEKELEELPAEFRD